MTAVQSPFSSLPPRTVQPLPEAPPLSPAWQKWDDTLDWLSEKLNPIVVKEARQALKSRQFTVTFGLLLVFGACWSALGVALQIRWRSSSNRAAGDDLRIVTPRLASQGTTCCS